ENPPTETIFQDPVLLTDALWLGIRATAASSPGDAFLFGSLDEFWPFTVIDRRGRVIGGGSFDVASFGSSAQEFERLCRPNASAEGAPLFMTMDPSSNISLSPDLTLNNFVFLPASQFGAGTGDVEITGRFIEGRALSGVALDTGTSDFDTLYPNVGYEFSQATDSSRVASTICDQTIQNQITLGYTRQGVVAPSLDEELMTSLFAAPAQYT